MRRDILDVIDTLKAQIADLARQTKPPARQLPAWMPELDPARPGFDLDASAEARAFEVAAVGAEAGISPHDTSTTASMLRKLAFQAHLMAQVPAPVQHRQQSLQASVEAEAHSHPRLTPYDASHTLANAILDSWQR